MKFLSLSIFSISFVMMTAQSNVRAWYQNGQVWIVWETTRNPVKPADFEKVYENDTITASIYSSSTLISNIKEATSIGRLFNAEWSGERLKSLGGDFFTIPDGKGGQYKLKPNEGLFVWTVRSAGSQYFAVVEDNVKYDETTMQTKFALQYPFNPGESPTAYVQTKTLDNGYPRTLYSLWIDGDDAYTAGRADFHIMGNRHRRGIPQHFVIFEPKDGIPKNTRIPVVHLLHGGNGSADYWRPTVKQKLDVAPKEEITVSHDDNLIRRANNFLMLSEGSWWFGYSRDMNPFIPLSIDPKNIQPFNPPKDTIFDYALQRLEWIFQWVNKNYPTDTNRISLLGHSVGSAGTMAWGKRDAHLFASITALNSGFDGPISTIPSVALFGTSQHNLVTNLKNKNGSYVRMKEIWDLTSHTSSTERDLPLTRTWCGKNDINPTMMWDSIVVKNYLVADKSGDGHQLWWDERVHGVDEWEGYFAHGILPSEQSERDNISYLKKYSRNISYPGFYNYSKYQNTPMPGNGNGGTSMNSTTFSGDDYGTWGGFLDWDTDHIVDNKNVWEVDAWLMNGSSNIPDNCPKTMMTFDLTVRRPQQFKPIRGTAFSYNVTRLDNMSVIAQGSQKVGADDIITLEKIDIPRLPSKVRIKLSTMVTANHEIVAETGSLRMYPNPTAGKLQLSSKVSQIRVYSLLGQLVLSKEHTDQIDLSRLNMGTYYIICNEEGRKNKFCILKM
jgi:pimeloyl-ACP methyl ester carboxylesterase